MLTTVSMVPGLCALCGTVRTDVLGPCPACAAMAAWEAAGTIRAGLDADTAAGRIPWQIASAAARLEDTCWYAVSGPPADRIVA